MIVTELAVTERVHLDDEQLRVLGARTDPAIAEDIVIRAMEDIAQRLGVIERALQTGDAQTLRKSARAIAAVAAQLGMRAVVRVAGDVVQCVDEGDAIATAATAARLLRVGESSFTAMWDLHDHAH